MVLTLAPEWAIPAGFVLLILPGLVFLATLRDETRAILTFDERLFATVAVSVAAAAWAALFLAELGVFSTVRAAGLLAAASALWFVLRRRHAANPFARAGRWKDALPAFLVLAASFGLFARPSEYVVGGRDPGSYVAAMGVIGRLGAISHVDPVVRSVPEEDLSLFYASPELPPFRFSFDVNEDAPQPSWPRFMGFELDHPKSGRVTPQFFHLFPAFGAYLFQTMGVKGALATPPLFGILGALGAFFLGRRLFGPRVALLGALLLTTNVLQIWFSRYPASETMSQFLLLAGLWAFVTGRDNGSRSILFAAGCLLGLSFLVRIDSVLLLAPVAVACGADLLVRRRGLAPFITPFLALLGHAVLHAALFSTRYAHQVLTRRYWNQPLAVWIAAVAAVVVAALLVHRFRARIADDLGHDASRLRRAAGLVVTLLFVYAFFVRGELSAWAGADGNARTDAFADGPAREALRALGFHRLAAHDAQALRRFSWFVGWPALALAVAGLTLWIRRARSRDLLPLLVVVSFACFYLYKIRVFNDYFFAMRRYVPLTAPFVFLLAALALVELYRRGAHPRAAAVGLGLAAAGASSAPALPLVAFSDWAGSARFVADVARRFGPKDVVIFEQPKTVHLVSLPLWALHGVNAIEFRRFNPDPDRLGHLVREWQRTYDNIYFVNSYRTDVCGLFLERVQPFRFASFEWEWTYDRVPSKPEQRIVDFALSRVIAPEDLRLSLDPVIDIGGSGDIQASGLYEREAMDGRSYRWSGACLDARGQAVASIYLPGLAPGDSIEVVATSNVRPGQARQPRVTASLGDVDIGEFVATSSWTAYRLGPSGAKSRLLRLSVPAWRPANTDRSSTDTRDLGIMIDQIRVIPARAPSRR